MSFSKDTLFPTPDEVPEQYRLGEYQEQREYLVNGELIEWTGDVNPIASPVSLNVDGSILPAVIGATPLLDAEASMAALDAAVNAYSSGHGEWPSMRIAERINHVEKFLVLMREQRDTVVKLLMWEIGKNLKDSEKEFDRTCDYIEDTCVSLKELDRNSAGFEIEQGTMAQIRRVPFGVAVCMGPYNYPLNETFSTLIPALIMGNTIVFKPAKYGVLLIRPLLKAFQDSFPAGAVNIIYGSGHTTITPLMQSGEVDVFAFIGTNKGAASLKKLHPKPHRLRSVLGLDAKNPGIVLPHADLDVAASECVAGALSFNGQRCTALKILLVHEDVAEKFAEKFLAVLAGLKSGMPWEPGVSLTPLPEPNKAQYLELLVADAVAKGASVINEGGGEFLGTFYYPAVLYPVTPDMRVYREEQFGPVIPIVTFKTLAEVSDYIVNAEFGQQLSIFGTDPEDVAKLIDISASQVGRINLNAQCQRGPDTLPFNGRKDSAEGTLSVSDALRQFSIRTVVAAKVNDASKDLVGGIIRDGRSDFLSTEFIF
jgi:glyceraldehyde-3-phosphate dehydrogenase (NADP+)